MRQVGRLTDKPWWSISADIACESFDKMALAMPPDPEEAALLIVQQFLGEHGMEEGE